MKRLCTLTAAAALLGTTALAQNFPSGVQEAIDILGSEGYSTVRVQRGTFGTRVTAERDGIEREIVIRQGSIISNETYDDDDDDDDRDRPFIGFDLSRDDDDDDNDDDDDDESSDIDDNDDDDDDDDDDSGRDDDDDDDDDGGDDNDDDDDDDDGGSDDNDDDDDDDE